MEAPITWQHPRYEVHFVQFSTEEEDGDGEEQQTYLLLRFVLSGEEEDQNGWEA